MLKTLEILPFVPGNFLLESLLRLMSMTPLTGAVFCRGVCDGGDGIWAEGFPLSLARASRTPTQ